METEVRDALAKYCAPRKSHLAVMLDFCENDERHGFWDRVWPGVTQMQRSRLVLRAMARLVREGLVDYLYADAIERAQARLEDEGV